MGQRAREVTGYLWRGQPGLEELNAAIVAARPAEVKPRGTCGPAPYPCGTLTAYRRHRRRHEEADEACLAAYREYDRTVRRGLGAAPPGRDRPQQVDCETGEPGGYEAGDRDAGQGPEGDEGGDGEQHDGGDGEHEAVSTPSAGRNAGGE
jgi:hypothetical protein